jgi:hypothetical protein
MRKRQFTWEMRGQSGMATGLCTLFLRHTSAFRLGGNLSADAKIISIDHDEYTPGQYVITVEFSDNEVTKKSGSIELSIKADHAIVEEGTGYPLVF